MAIETPADIYDELFDEVLNPRWQALKSVPGPEAHLRAEMVGRVIEFLEKHLEREENKEVLQ